MLTWRILIIIGSIALSAAAQATVIHGAGGNNPAGPGGAVRINGPYGDANKGASSDRAWPAIIASGEKRPSAHRGKRYAPAEALLALALEKRERKLGKDHRFTLTTVNSLALIYKAQGRYQEAETLYKRALESSERTLGKKHPFTVSAVRNLALLYKAQGRKAEAEPLIHRAQQSVRDASYKADN